MKFIIGLSMLCVMLSFGQADGLYSIVLRSIDGNTIDLRQYKGKKLLFIQLPIASQDTTVLVGEVSQLQTKYRNSVVIIGVPSLEAGYKEEDAGKFKKIYSDAGANFIIAEGMKVKKGAGQSSLFQWLTNKDSNRHFDHEVVGIGTKCFVDETGDLYAIVGPQLKLTNPLIDRILTRVPKSSTAQKKN